MTAFLRLDLAYRVNWETSWHVGSGSGSLMIDRLQARRRVSGRTQGESFQPFVPGSQVKGVLRHRCEQLAAALGEVVIDPHVGGPERNAELARQFQPLNVSELLIDRLFGTRYEGGCLYVSDALPEEARPRTDVHSRIALDRLTGTVKRRHLFQTEVVVDVQAPLVGRIRGRHRPDVLWRDVMSDDGAGFPLEYSLLIAGLLRVDALGGDKSAGRGRCRITLDDLRWNGQPFPEESALELIKDFETRLELAREQRGSQEAVS